MAPCRLWPVAPVLLIKGFWFAFMSAVPTLLFDNEIDAGTGKVAQHPCSTLFMVLQSEGKRFSYCVLVA